MDETEVSKLTASELGDLLERISKDLFARSEKAETGRESRRLLWAFDEVTSAVKVLRKEYRIG